MICRINCSTNLPFFMSNIPFGYTFRKPPSAGCISRFFSCYIMVFFLWKTIMVYPPSLRFFAEQAFPHIYARFRHQMNRKWNAIRNSVIFSSNFNPEINNSMYIKFDLQLSVFVSSQTTTFTFKSVKSSFFLSQKFNFHFLPPSWKITDGRPGNEIAWRRGFTHSFIHE